LFLVHRRRPVRVRRHEPDDLAAGVGDEHAVVLAREPHAEVGPPALLGGGARSVAGVHRSVLVLRAPAQPDGCVAVGGTRSADRDAAARPATTGAVRRPCARSSSACRIAPPAAPRIVLCERTTNLNPRPAGPMTGHARTRPTETCIPPPARAWRRGCGNRSSSNTRIGRAGALGRSRPATGLSNDASASATASALTGSRRRTETHSRWPSSTGTRLHCAEIAISAGRTAPLSSVPRIFSGSAAIFSSSPPMYGTTLASASSDETPG